MMSTLGTRAGLCFGLCWFGCLGVIDHSAGTGLDFLSGLAIVAAVDRLLSRGSDWVAGIWTAAGLPDGRMAARRPDLADRDRDRPKGGGVLAAAPHSARRGRTRLVALGPVARPRPRPGPLRSTLPLTERPSWGLGPRDAGCGLAVEPLGRRWRSAGRLRESWSNPGRRMMAGWVQASLACAVAGTIVPGLAQAARVPALAGLLMTAALGLEAAWSRTLTQECTSRLPGNHLRSASRLADLCPVR